MENSKEKTKNEPEIEICDDINEELISNILLIAFGFLETQEVNSNRTEAGWNNEESRDSDSEKTIEDVPGIPRADNNLSNHSPIIRWNRDPRNRLPLKDSSAVCISFGGCGFLGSYEFGAAKMLFEHGKALLARTTRYAGCSSGSLVASMMMFNPEKILDAVEHIYRLADEVNLLPLGAMTPGFVIGDRLRNVVEQYIPENISMANKKLYVSVTKLNTWENKLIHEFRDKKHFIDVLMASCYHPMYSTGWRGKTPNLDGELYIDGGYTNVLPEFLDIRTVSITPFSGDADICPIDQNLIFSDSMLSLLNQNLRVSLKNVKRLVSTLFPPTRDTLKQYFDYGAADAERVLKENGLFNK